MPALLFLGTWRWWDLHTAHPPPCEQPVEAFQTTFPEQVSPFLHPDTFPHQNAHSGLNWVPPTKLVCWNLTPRTSECDCIWRWGF